MMDKIVYYAVVENRNNRERLRNKVEHKGISKIQWMKDYCTIHLNIGRNTGKTKHIIESAESEDLIVCRDGTREYIQSKTNKMLNFYVPHIDKLFYDKIREECQIVFVDEPKQTLKPFRDGYEFYSLFTVNLNEPIFIMLGE